MPALSLVDLATSLGTTPDHLRASVRRALGRVPRRRYYVFRITGAQAATRSTGPRSRTITAFPSPDAALAFAQRNGHGSNVQISSISPAELVLLLLKDPSVGAILFLDDQDDPGASTGSGVKLERADLLGGESDPAPQPAAPQTLSAKQYDALQFGVQFRDRAEFRVALTEAIENVVATYEPPAGSIDRGPRSIFAATAVEAWLREHGFPHAHQRRWIDVAGAPEWGGADELIEIDGGTVRGLLIQLLIHTDDSGRQYIKQVNVTV